MKTRLYRFILSLAAVVVSVSACGQGQCMPQDGDIVFHESKSRQSPVIKLAQHSRWTHCGIVFHIGEKAYVYEAVGPVKYTPLKDWIARGKKGEYCVKRLKTPLSAADVEKMKAAGAKVDALDCVTLAKQAGSTKAVNVVLLGRLSHYFDLPETVWQEALEALVPPKFLELNKKAFELGRNA